MNFPQELRNKLYAVATAVFGVLVIIGVWDQVSSDEATTILNSVLDLLDRVAALAVSVTAFVKSRPGKVTVLDVPKADVEGVLVNTTQGNTLLAGPASPEVDGTVVAENVTIFEAADLSGTLDPDDEPGRHVAGDSEV